MRIERINPENTEVGDYILHIWDSTGIEIVETVRHKYNPRGYEEDCMYANNLFWQYEETIALRLV